MRKAFLVSIGLLAHAVAARAQLNEQTISRELAEALLLSSQGIGALVAFSGGGPPSRPIIVADKLPAEMTGRAFVPPGSRVLGGYGNGASAVAIMITPLSRDSIAAMYLREQKKLGWTVPADEAQRAPARVPWGFVNPPPQAVATKDNNSGMIFCSGGDAMMVSIEPVRAPEHRVTLVAGHFAQMLCPSARREPPFVMRGSPLPTLFHPLNAGRDQCPEYSSSGSGQDGRVSTTLSPDSILTHYAKQLADSGWRAVDTRAVAQRFAKSDSTGEKFLEISVTTVGYAGPLCREVNMRYWERR